ncbi:hypothetical protein PV325_014039, partial [Microctonus aethiopoides]
MESLPYMIFTIHIPMECINGIQAALFINVLTRIMWFKRIRIEDDPRPAMVHYYTPLTPPSLEDEWHFDDDDDDDDYDTHDDNNNEMA